jgi:hypothetical protein
MDKRSVKLRLTVIKNLQRLSELLQEELARETDGDRRPKAIPASLAKAVTAIVTKQKKRPKSRA